MTQITDSVLGLVKTIPLGKVTTYKELAKALGNEKACRAIGNALKKNPKLIEIPCHRVVRSDGQVGGYKLGQKKKEELLKSEGITIMNHKIPDMERYLYTFSKSE